MTTLPEFVEAHTQVALTIMRNKENLGKSNERADELEVAARHLFCCWLLKEATFTDIEEICSKYNIEPIK